MNNKIRAAEVACLIDGSEAYEQVFRSLKDALPSDEEMIFAERTSGYGFLQWELPGDDWISLDKGDPIQSIEMKKELERRIQHVRSKFGENQVMADKILVYPDDSYAFFKTTPDGKLLLLLTAWGYRHPERIDGGSAGGRLAPETPMEQVALSFIYGGKPMAAKPFQLNEFAKTTDAEGNFEVGKLPVGYQFDVKVNGQRHHFKVAENEGKISIDATVYTDVEVTAFLDGKPYSKAEVGIDYWGQQTRLVTDDEGKATVRLPLADEGQPCKVTVGTTSQSKPLSEKPTQFLFEMFTPEPEKPVETPPAQPETPAQPEPQAPESTKEEEIAVEPEKDREGGFPAVLFILGLAALVAAAFYFGWRCL